ncbi:hypothetical protein A2U01_0111563, partial [Trifolium medium]|nr:hypothetical protein [Trifolium medium]
VMERGARLWYQAIAPFLRVVGNILHLIAPLTLKKFRVALTDAMCSSGSESPS